jgi:hypothetical protein
MLLLGVFDAANNHIGMHTVKDGVNKGTEAVCLYRLGC